MTKNQIEFQYDKANDIVVANARWHVKTPEDVVTWTAQHNDYFALCRPKGRCDLRASRLPCGCACGRHLGRGACRDHAHYSYRVGFQGAAKTYTFTSGIRYAASSAIADTVEQAVSEILRHRKEEP